MPRSAPGICSALAVMKRSGRDAERTFTAIRIHCRMATSERSMHLVTRATLGHAIHPKPRMSIQTSREWRSTCLKLFATGHDSTACLFSHGQHDHIRTTLSLRSVRLSSQTTRCSLERRLSIRVIRVVRGRVVRGSCCPWHVFPWPVFIRGTICGMRSLTSALRPS